MRVTVGADPEFFLKDAKGVNIAAVGIVPGTKVAPYQLPKGAVQLDGTAVEFNIRPALTKLGFVTNIKSTLNNVRKMVPKEFAFDFSPSVEYDKAYFDSLPDHSKVLGCDPDFDAYKDGEVNTPPDNKTTMRTGAGHIHIGWGKGFDVEDPDHVWDCCQITKMMDDFLYPFSWFWDKDTKRQRMYGKPGAFRPKPYGVEYRTLSNAWLGRPVLWPWLHEVSKFVPKLAEQGNKRSAYYRKAAEMYNYMPYMAATNNGRYKNTVQDLAASYKISTKDVPAFPIEEFV